METARTASEASDASKASTCKYIIEWLVTMTMTVTVTATASAATQLALPLKLTLTLLTFQPTLWLPVAFCRLLLHWLRRSKRTLSARECGGTSGGARGGGNERRGMRTLLLPPQATHAGEEAMPASGGHGTAPGENPAGAVRSKWARCEMCEMCERCDAVQRALKIWPSRKRLGVRAVLIQTTCTPYHRN